MNLINRILCVATFVAGGVLFWHALGPARLCWLERDQIPGAIGIMLMLMTVTICSYAEVVAKEKKKKY